MSNLDSLQFPLQLSHMNLFLFDPVQDLLLRPCDLFLNTQVNTRQTLFYWLNMFLNNNLLIMSDNKSIFSSSLPVCRVSRSGRRRFCVFDVPPGHRWHRYNADMSDNTPGQVNTSGGQTGNRKR